MWGSPAFGELADQGYHLELGRAFAQAWQAGELPPRWSATANGGRGSPAFELYPPLFAFLTACWMNVAGSGQEALRFSSLSALVFNLCLIYWAARAWLSRRRALLAASLAMLLPGTTFVALGRGMFPNFFALGWAALAAGAIQRRNPWALAIAGAGLVLTHTPTAYLAALTAAALLAARTFRPAASTYGAGVAALALSCWFWLPMLETAQHAQTGYLAEAHPYADSLWFAGAPQGGTQDEFAADWSFLNSVAAYIGLAQLALAAMLIALTRNRALAVLAGLVAAASLWPTGVWLTALPFYESVQFCWRWQPLLAIACALAFASLPWRAMLRAAPVAGAVVGLFLPVGAPSDQAPAQRPSLASNLIEMRPHGASSERYPPGAPGRVETIEGECRAIPVEIRPSARLYHVTAQEACRLRLLTYHFPGWRATLDEVPIPVQREPETQLQIVRVPSGLHQLRLDYRRPPPRRPPPRPPGNERIGRATTTVLRPGPKP